MSKMEPEVEQAAAQAQADARNKKRRKRLFLLLGGVVLKAALGYGIYAYGYATRYVSTDNAYTGAETAQVTPAIGGIVREVRVTDTQPVKQGDVVVVIDDTDARLALDQAEAELGRAVRRVRGYVAND
jgi:membrane fusion protein, multidrug efflux system